MFRRSTALSAGRYPIPNLDLNYAATGALSGIETFTRASSAWAFNQTGTLSQYAANTPRFDYDPATLASRGLLVEEQRTNLLLNSNTFSAWSNSGLSVTGSSGTAPSGSNDAWLLGAGVAEGRGALIVAIPADTTVYAYSIHLKAGSSAVTDIRLSFVGGSEYDARVTWATAGISVKKGTHAFSPSLQNIGGGWYRAVMGVANTSRTQVLPYIFPAGQGTSATGNVLAFGAQLEAGSFATSYIPTTSASATRAADTCSISLGAFGYDSAEGTLFAEFLRSAGTNSQQGRAASLSNGSNANLIEIYQAGAATPLGQIYSDGNVQAQFGAAGGAPDTVQRAAIAWAAGASAFCAGGTTVQADTSTVAPPVTSLRVGDRWDGARNLNGNIRRIAYYPRALETAILGRITS
ncbi:hypothetical protein SAE02_25180 [Skermanella aerolata]|uniref:Uncharacterized protein n=1 Tax=Skermanella aerolata TaxID=393310 RepID=A0A512DQC8_9PROT|nr:hypothetical protein [Skermanella aerolata]KJB95869.1 hypothetical protein N826_39610 [Skermanella aerolata KACC 11604]GEO38370.1 hypothetical protein SAE02_25180 [Skermanella aerolata]